MKNILAFLSLVAALIFAPSLTTPAAAQPCQWNYSMPNNRSLAYYCGDVTVAGTITGALAQNTYPSMTVMSALTSAQMASFGTLILQSFNEGLGKGGGTFIFLNAAQASALTPNGGTIIAPSNNPSSCSSGCLVKQLYAPVTPYDFGAICDGAADDTAEFSGAINSHTKVYVPANANCKLVGAVSVPAGETLTIDGTLSGTDAWLEAVSSITVNGSGTLNFDKSSTSGFAIRVHAGAIDVSGITITSPNYSQVAISVLPSGTITSFKVSDIYVWHMVYAILRNVDHTITVQQALITGNNFYDLSGDAVEWNIGTNDSQVSVTSNNINWMHSTLANQGLAIGIAGGTYAYPPPNATQRVLIADNNIYRTAEAIHCESCFQVKISGNIISGIDKSLGVSLCNCAIDVIGSFDASITDNHVSEAVAGTYGAIIVKPGVAGSYVVSQENMVISRNTAINSGGVAAVCLRQDSPTLAQPVTMTVTDNVVLNGELAEQGPCTLNISRNVVQSIVGANGLTIDYKQAALGTSANYLYTVVIQGNTVADKFGTVKTSIIHLCPPSFANNISLSGGGNTFNIQPCNTTDVSPSGNIYKVAQASFPVGKQFQIGDTVFSTTSGTAWTVTGAGSLNPATDTATVFSVPNGELKTSSNNWTLPNMHYQGQLITLTDGSAHVVNAMVGYINIDAGTAVMFCIDPATGAVSNLSSLVGTVTITATTVLTHSP